MQAIQASDTQIKRERESIHSGHFMISTFEAEEQDDEDEVAVPIPEVVDATATAIVPVKRHNQNRIININFNANMISQQQQLSIDTSLSKLFQCMSLAYRQKLTSPKWNRFRGIRLRWKDKIRLNNVIWRCWHLQFIKKENTLICQFASPLDVDTHNKPEAVVLEGKYWKRKLAACTAEYKKWRMFYRNHTLGHSMKDDIEMLTDADLLAWNSPNAENMDMMVDEDYMGLMSDTLFSTITNQTFQFPDSREIARAGLADFIQPSLGPLQPNLDDYMDTFEQEFIVPHKLPTVPEEQSHAWSEFYMNTTMSNNDQYQGNMSIQQCSKQNNQAGQEQDLYQSMIQEQQAIQQAQQINYNSVISKNKCHPTKVTQQKLVNQQQQQPQIQVNPYEKSIYPTYVDSNIPSGSAICNLNEVYETQMSQQVQASQAMLQHQQQQNFGQYKVHNQEQAPSLTSGYKYTITTTPNLKFDAPVQVLPHHINAPSYNSSSSSSSSIMLSEKRNNGSVRSTSSRGKQRSRSNTRETPRRPPLISAVSDPALLNPTKSALLTQLLSNTMENETMYNHRNHNVDRQQLLHAKPIRIKEENTPIPILPQPQPTTTLLITNAVLPPTTDPLMLNSFSNSNSPLDSPSQQPINSPTSSQGSIGSPNRDGPRDSRRVGHIHAEQKRRYNIKNGFDMIHTLIPHLNQNPNTKLSKAAMLQKGAEYIRQLRSERNQLTDEMEGLKQQIENLNQSISNCQSMLPATGAPVSRRRDTKMQEMFDDYIRSRTMENWKYWMFSLLFRPLLESFNNFVVTSSLDDLYRSTVLWIEQHCTLGDLRPVVINSLKYLSTKTDILSKPEKLPDEARQIVNSNQK